MEPVGLTFRTFPVKGDICASVIKGLPKYIPASICSPYRIPFVLTEVAAGTRLATLMGPIPSLPISSGYSRLSIVVPSNCHEGGGRYVQDCLQSSGLLVSVPSVLVSLSLRYSVSTIVTEVIQAFTSDVVHSREPVLSPSCCVTWVQLKSGVA